ncbi:hypothetical protein N0V88_001924 [Collariella sp. IMI 366227]|nr:hypothetical protein N0V88_001924 [Collariella sp. IMI 366227]
MEGERHGLYESVFKAFDAILRVTSPRKNQTAGPKSLMALCLRKVPAYISALEDWERKESENNGTKSAVQGAGASFETYLELESLGAVDGWRQLCLVVRAHAVKIIQDAAAEGLLEDPVTDLLIRVCLEYMSPTEFMGLIDTFVFRQYPKPHSPNDDLFTTSALQPLKILKICDPLGTSLLPSVLADLLAEELLQADWILTESFVSLWPSMIRQITEMKPCQDTVEFVVATLENLCDLASPKKPRGVPQTKLRGKSQTTLISAAAALGSVVLLSEEGSTEMASGSSPTNRAVTLRRRITYIVTTCTAKLKHRKTGGRKLGTYILALCSFLSLPASPPSSPTISSSSSITIQTAWKDVTTCHNNPTLLLQYDATTALMSAMAHHLGRGTGLPPHIYLSQFCDQLATLALSPTALSNMRVDGAFRLAEQTGDLRDLEWAEGLRVEQTATMAMAVTPVKKTMSTRSGRKRGKRKAKSFSGFEWDDGISEWVAATPGMEARPAAARVRRLTVSGIVESEDEDEQMKDETDEEMDHGMDETASETEPNEVDSASDDDDDDSNAASETDPDEGEAEEPTLSPNTEPSPAPVSQPVPEPEPPKPQPQQSDAPAPDKASPGRALPPPSRAMPPPPPPGGFLAARPRRLSRPVPQTVDDQPTIANNIDNNTSAQESFLLRKKPTRFRSRIPIAIPATRKEPAVQQQDRDLRLRQQ